MLKYADNYEAFAVRNGMRVDAKTADGKRIVTKEDGTMLYCKMVWFGTNILKVGESLWK